MYFNTINFPFCFSAKLREVSFFSTSKHVSVLLLDVGKQLITLLDLLKEIASLFFHFLSLLFFYLSSLLKKVDERRKSMSKVWRNGKVVTELVVPCSSCETVSNKVVLK